MTHPLWLDPAAQAYPSLEGNLEVDLAIVGAGFSGLGAAWALAGSGQRVAVLEARTVGAGASGRNAGFLLAGPAAGVGAIQTLGEDETATIWEFTRQNHATLAGIIGRQGIECGYLRRGSLSLAASEAEWEELQANAALLAPYRVITAPLSAGQLPQPFDQLYRGGLYFPGNGELNPGAFLRRLAATLSAPILLFEYSPVMEMERAHRWQLRTAAGMVSAERVILCTNAYTHRLLPWAPIVPTRGQVAATAPLSRVVVPFPMYADHGFQYWRQTAGGVLVVGGWRNLAMVEETGETEMLHGQIQQVLADFAARVAGEPPDLRHRWAGIMGFTPDAVPLVGAVDGAPDLFLAAGYSGHGVAMAFLCGARVAQRALGQAAFIPASFCPARFAQSSLPASN